MTNDHLGCSPLGCFMQSQSSCSVQNNNPEKQVNALNLKNSITLEKAKTSRQNQVSHSTTCDYSSSPRDFNDSNIGVKENIPNLSMQIKSSTVKEAKSPLDF